MPARQVVIPEDVRAQLLIAGSMVEKKSFPINFTSSTSIN